MEKITGYYNGAKAWIASQIASQVPCEWLGEKLQADCKEAVEQVVGAAISVGLVAVGLPPSLPSLQALSDGSKGKLADAAVEASCQAFESNGGKCTAAMREKLKAAYRSGLDALQKKIEADLKHAATQPGCGDATAAAEHGKLPLPCFGDYPGVVVQAASGTVYQPPLVKVRATRKLPQPQGVQGCNRVSLSMWMTNTFKGGTLGSKQLPAAAVSGWAYKTVVVPIPPVNPGQSIEFSTALHDMGVVQVPGNFVQSFYLPNWLVLYRGGKGSLTASMLASVTSGTGSVAGYCAADATWPVQIPP